MHSASMLVRELVVAVGAGEVEPVHRDGRIECCDEVVEHDEVPATGREDEQWCRRRDGSVAGDRGRRRREPQRHGELAASVIDRGRRHDRRGHGCGCGRRLRRGRSTGVVVRGCGEETGQAQWRAPEHERADRHPLPELLLEQRDEVYGAQRVAAAVEEVRVGIDVGATERCPPRLDERRRAVRASISAWSPSVPDAVGDDPAGRGCGVLRQTHGGTERRAVDLAVIGARQRVDVHEPARHCGRGQPS